MSTQNRKRLLVISSYPPKGQTHHAKIVGVASYTKNTIDALSKDTEITVLAEQLPLEENAYVEKNVTVKRVWKRNAFMLFPVLLKEAILYYKDTTQIIIAVELAMFGGKIQLTLLPLFIAILRLFGKEVTVVLHQVIADIEDMSGHIYTYSGWTALFLNFLIGLYYKAMLSIASQCIVMDEVLKQRLSKFGSTKHVIVIPHGVEAFVQTPSKKAARANLGISEKSFVLLYFGFLAWYKGADVLINAFAQIPKSKRTHVKLIMAGGPNPNHMDKETYRKYIQDIEIICRRESIALIGFVPEQKIATYFSAADLVLFPYRTLMSASGPLSLAFSFGKPFLVSKEMTSLTQTKDIKDCLRKSKMTSESISIDMQKNFQARLSVLRQTKAALAKLTTFSKAMQNARSWSILGKSYDTAIFGK